MTNATMAQTDSPYNVPGFLTKGIPLSDSAMRMFLGTSNPAYCRRGDTLNIIVVKKLIHFFRISDFYSHFAHHPNYFNIIATDCNCPVDLVPVLRERYIEGRNAWLKRKALAPPQAGITRYAATLAALVDRAKAVDGRIRRGDNVSNDQIPQRAVEKSILKAREIWQSLMQADPMSLLFSPSRVHSTQSKKLPDQRNGDELTSRRPVRGDQSPQVRFRSASPASRHPGTSDRLEVEYPVRTPLGGSSGRQFFSNESTARSALTGMSLDHVADKHIDATPIPNSAVTAASQLPSTPTTKTQKHPSTAAKVATNRTKFQDALKTKVAKPKTRSTKPKKSSRKRDAVLQACYNAHIAKTEQGDAKLQADMEELKTSSNKRYADLEAKCDKLAATSGKHAEDIRFYEYAFAHQSLQIKDLRKELNRHEKIFTDVEELLKSWEDELTRKDK